MDLGGKSSLHQIRDSALTGGTGAVALLVCDKRHAFWIAPFFWRDNGRMTKYKLPPKIPPHPEPTPLPNDDAVAPQ